MADLEFDEFEGDYGTPGYGMADDRIDRAKRLVNLAGAICSVALVMGLGLWGYQLAVRDVAGVPVMRALGGPMRVAPADPGGNQASHQGLSVNAIAATGTAAPPSEQLTLAPRATELLPGDGTGLLSTTGSDEEAATLVQANLQISGSATSGTQVSLQAGDPAPLNDGAPPPIDTSTGVAVDPLNAEVEPTRVAALVTSLRPRSRPANLSKPAASDTARVQNASAPAVELDPATVQIGTRLAQVGTFDTPEQARIRFGELTDRFAELLAGKAYVIQAATSGGKTFYRLRAQGFDGDDDSRRFCAMLKADDVDCIPTSQR